MAPLQLGAVLEDTLLGLDVMVEEPPKPDHELFTLA